MRREQIRWIAQKTAQMWQAAFFSLIVIPQKSIEYHVESYWILQHSMDRSEKMSDVCQIANTL